MTQPDPQGARALRREAMSEPKAEDVLARLAEHHKAHEDDECWCPCLGIATAMARQLAAAEEREEAWAHDPRVVAALAKSLSRDTL